jgi:hypothetical protein
MRIFRTGVTQSDNDLHNSSSLSTEIKFVGGAIRKLGFAKPLTKAKA